MKLLAPIGVAVLCACSGPEHGQARRPDPGAAPTAATVSLDFQTGFNRSQVVLEVDGRRVFSGTLTTDNRVGLARSFHVPEPDSRRLTVTVTLGQAAPETRLFELDRGRYLGFSRNLDTGRLQIEQREHPFEYD
jgi:hypothetical protein